jgi:hypothetical protein
MGEQLGYRDLLAGGLRSADRFPAKVLRISSRAVTACTAASGSMPSGFGESP